MKIIKLNESANKTKVLVMDDSMGAYNEFNSDFINGLIFEVEGNLEQVKFFAALVVFVIDEPTIDRVFKRAGLSIKILHDYITEADVDYPDDYIQEIHDHEVITYNETGIAVNGDPFDVMFTLDDIYDEYVDFLGHPSAITDELLYKHLVSLSDDLPFKEINNKRINSNLKEINLDAIPLLDE